MSLKPICPPDRCTGCMACINSCAHGAIVIEEDSLGFRFPKIDTDKCTGCGLCESACPELRPRTLTFPLQCYAAAMKQPDELLSCASGGAATALSAAVIARGGAVCGCTGEELPHARHIIVDTIEGLDRLKGSKYVQSDISADLLKQIRTMLVAGREVLFIGTGCQVAGLQNFLRKPYDNLTTVDLVCHGVPSQKMLADNMKLYPEADPASIRFRVKEPESDGSAIRFGWSQTTRIGSSAKPMFVDWDKDPYLAAFMDCLTFRPCCYDCRYAYSARGSDITICDFWGLGNDSRLYNSYGVSAIIISTPRGEQSFQAAELMMTVERRPIREAIAGNGQLMLPSKTNPRRKQFEVLYAEHGFAEASRLTAMKSIRKNEFKKKCLRFISRILALKSKIKSKL